MRGINSICTRIYKQEGCNSLVELLVKHRASERLNEGRTPPKEDNTI
jgi:hypothetical protein